MILRYAIGTDYDYDDLWALCNYSLCNLVRTVRRPTCWLCAVLCCVVSLISTRLSGEEAKMSLLYAGTEIPAQRATPTNSAQQLSSFVP